MAKRGSPGYTVTRNFLDGNGARMLQRQPPPGTSPTQTIAAGVFNDVGLTKEDRALYKRYEKKFGELIALRTMSEMLGRVRWAILAKNKMSLPKTGEAIHVNAGWGLIAKKWKFKSAEVGHLLLFNEYLSLSVEVIKKRLREYPDSQLFCECGCGSFAPPGVKYVNVRHTRHHMETLRRLRLRLGGQNPWRDKMRRLRKTARRRPAH